MALSVAIALSSCGPRSPLSYQTNYPVGFFVGTLSAAAYALGRGWTVWGPGAGAVPGGGDDPRDAPRPRLYHLI